MSRYRQTRETWTRTEPYEEGVSEVITTIELTFEDGWVTVRREDLVRLLMEAGYEPELDQESRVAGEGG